MTKLAKVTLVAALFMLPLTSFALTITSVGDSLDLGSKNPEEIVVNVINWVLGILALIAVILVIYGGFMWMTAGGNTDRVDSAKKILISAVIGLVIILAAWGISVYAINILGGATDSV